MSKSLKITIAVVVAVLVIASIVGLILLLMPTKVPNNSLTQRLETPKNVSIDVNDWVLSFDAVENAQSYQIIINNADTFVTNKTRVSVASYITRYDRYSFEVCAIHSTPDYNSLRSAPVYGYNTTTLSTPLNLSWEGDVLSWLAVDNAQSYNVALKYKPNGSQNEVTTKILTQANLFDFGDLVTQAPYSEINFFELSVQASSTDAYGTVNPYIYNSEYSDAAIYFRTTSIDAPSIRISPDVRNQNSQQGTARTLSWDVDFAVEEYWVYINGQLRKVVTADELEGKATYSLDLNSILVDGVAITDTMGTKAIYVTAIPKTNEYYHIESRTSETIEYTVVHKLSAPDVSSIRIYKEGGNLVITWKPVEDTYGVNTRYTPTSYNLILLTNSDTENPSYVARAPVTDLLIPTYSIPLSELSALGISFKVQICAVDSKSQYILDSDYSELSEAYEAVTKLETPDGVSLNESNGVDTLTWRAVTNADSYTVMVYMGSIDPDTNVISAIGSPLVMQEVNETRLTVSSYMKAHLPNPLDPGIYAIRIVANSLSQFYTSSEASEAIKYDYKVRLSTPVVQSVSKVPQADNKGNITLTFDYIEGAQRYYINVNGILAFIMEQPALDSDIVTSVEVGESTTYRIVDTTRLTNFINNNYSTPQVHTITVQAIIYDTSTANGYISSLLSPEYKFSDYYTHARPTNIRANQDAGSNTVSLVWDSVPSVVSSNGTYEIFVIDSIGKRAAVNTSDIVGSTVADLSPYLQLGNNTIRIRSAFGGLYLASDYAWIDFEYIYQLSGTANTTVTPVAGTKNNRLVINSSQNSAFRYVTDYYIEFINSNGVVFNYLNVHTYAGADVNEVLSDAYFPLFKTTTVKVYAGKIRQGDGSIVSQSTFLNPDGCEWSISYESNSYMEAPSITHTETIDGKVYAQISVDVASLPFTQSIEWTFSGTTGISYTDYINITDTVTNTFTIDLSELQLVCDASGALLGGGYSIYATAISSNSTELRSETRVYTFDIIIDLATPSGFIMADDQSYLQWNYIANVDNYVVLFNGTEMTGAVVGEYTDYIAGSFVPVMRVNTTGWFDSITKGQNVVFEIRAIAADNGYYRNSSATYNWQFNNKLNAPRVEFVTKNNQRYLQILASSLASSYTVICDSSYLTINTELSLVENGYVYFNLETALLEKYAGEYLFKVYANPLSPNYDTSDASEIIIEWTKRFEQPTITVTQNFDNNTLTFSWNDVGVNVVKLDNSLEMIKPSGYLITVTAAGVLEPYVTSTVTENSLTLTANELALMTSGYYFVSVTALSNGVMLDSFESAYRFAYQQQLSTPTIAFVSGNTLANDGTLDIRQTGEIDANALKFDLKVVNSSGIEEIFEGLAWSGNYGTLLGGTHFTERGEYTISVRNAQNGSLAASGWSNELITRYGASFEVAENISMTYTPENTEFTVRFDSLPLPDGVDATYTASVTYNGNTQNIASDEISLISGNTHSFSFVNPWGDDAWSENSQFKIVITATTTDDLVPTSSTTYIFVIGKMVAPYDIVMSTNGAEISLNWKGDTNCTEVVYSYSVELMDGDGTKYYLGSTGWTNEIAGKAILTTSETTTKFTLPSNSVFVIYFTISASGKSGDNTVSSAEKTYTYINTSAIHEIDDFTVTYNPTTGEYKAEWTNVLKNSTVFTGGTYSFKINGTEIPVSNTDSDTISVDITSYVAAFLVNGRIAYWEITVTDAIFNDGTNSYIAYKGGVYSNSVVLPIVISAAPENLALSGTVANWSMVRDATKYKLYIADASDADTPLTFSDDTNREIITNQTRYDFGGLLDGLDAGDYLVVVQVVADEANGIYTAPNIAKKTAPYLQSAALNDVTNLSFTQSYAGGQSRTVVTWNYDTAGEFSLGDMIFDVTITDKFGARVSYNGVTATLGSSGSKLTYTEVGGDTTKGLFRFNYLDRSNDDKTVTLAGGECVFTVVVSGVRNSGYYTASNGASGTYKNIFGLQPVTDENIFAIAPECFIKGVTNNEIAGYEEGLKDDFEAYESTIGFNEKYLIITDDTLSYAEYFKVYLATSVDGDNNYIYEYVGDIANISTEMTFDAISNTTAKLRLPNAIAGINSIKLVPCGNEEYFKYIDGGTAYELSSETAIERLSSSAFDVELFMRNDAPNLNIHSIKLSYSDSQDKKNINSIRLTFSNLKIGGVYSVTPYYFDYYNDGALVTCDSIIIGPLTAADFDGSVPKGLELFDAISYYGPHEFYFTVQSIVPEGENSQYWLNSQVSKTPNSFEFVTKLMEFAPALDGDSSVNSLVNAISNKTAGGTLNNGYLYWTLPTHPYSVRVLYTVSMCDENQTLGNIMQFGEKHIIKYSVYLNIEVTASATTYTLGEQSMLRHGTTTSLSSTPCFKLDVENNMVVFDMTRYFADSMRVADNQNGKWYLAGSYTYMITAQAQAFNEPYSCARISSPASFGTESAMIAYNYVGIPFPYKPTQVRLSATGDLTWNYNDEMYDSAILDTAVFEIWVYNWDENRANYTISKLDDYVYGVVPTNISALLIAGGAKRNDVVIRTVSPDSNIYEPSEWVEVNTGALPTTADLPNIDVVWGNDESLKNNDHRYLAITLDNYVSDAILKDIEANNCDVHINVSLLKVNTWTAGDPIPSYANLDEAREAGDFPIISWNQPFTESYYNYIAYKNHEGLDYKFNLVNAINALVGAGLENEVLWLVGGDSLAGGYYYAKVELTTALSSYSSTVVYKSKQVREVWRSSQEQASISGAFLTTKTLNVAASPVGNNDRDWGEIDHKEALLTIPVNTISYRTSPTTISPKLPSEITVYARLYTGSGYDLDCSYELTYSIPDVSLITNGKYSNGDITLSLISDSDYSRINVTIDIHELFDENTHAGVYDIFWVLNGDEVGDSSPVDTPYQLREEVCHYVVLPTPILDYRLSYTGTNSDQYVINWVLTPNKYTYEVNDNVDYNINLYAFVADDNGHYATDELEANDAEFLAAKNQKKYFVGNANASGSTIENYTPTILNNRRCYIQQNSIAGFSLTPNKTYKIYVYLSTARYGETDDVNSLYYLNSDTSKGVEYLYKKVSGQHVASDTTEPTSVYPLEKFTDADRELVEQGAYYTFNSLQPDNYNNAFELYVYNTQDPRAGYDSNWTTAQENDGTYLAHFIIGTRDNMSASGNSQDLYILYDYEDKVIGSGRWDYSRSVGRLQNKAITLNGLTLSELLYNKVTLVDGLDLNKIWTPITYYCKIKTWLNNNEVNANMPTYLGTDNVLRYKDKDTIFGKEWIASHIDFVRSANGTLDSDKLNALYDALNRENKPFDLPFLDINSLNLSCYFKFQHKIKYAMPSLPSENGIEIVNGDGTSDYVGYSTIDLGNGVYQYLTDGYIVATSGYDYYYRIWLNDLYTLDPLIRSDKEIQVTVGATNYDETTGGSGNYGDYNNVNWAIYDTAVNLIVHYVDENNTELSPEFIAAHRGQAYLEIRADGIEDGVGAMYSWMDEWLPNIFTFTFSAVTSASPKINTGETNATNSFITINNITGTANETSTEIERIYIQSDTSTHANYLTVRKQYTSPTVSLRYDTMQNQLTEGGNMQAYRFESLGGGYVDTNLVDATQNAEYAGLAANPYLYSVATEYSQNFEYAFLKTNTYTNYEIILYYKSDAGEILATSRVISLKTNDVNNTLTRFAAAVAGKDVDSARFNYSNYTDIYPYSETCLYQEMYKLINGNQTTGNYRGGRIDIDIRVVTPSEDRTYKENQNWVTSEWASDERNVLATVYYHPRLETVKTTFKQSECNFTTDFEGGTSSFYTQVGKYYYHQSYIPLHYTTISRNTQYYVYLSRTQGGSNNKNLPYNIDNSVVRDLCILSPKNTDTENIKNLTDILKQDLFDAKTYDTANDATNGYANQWRLPGNSNDTWLINIIAAVDDSMIYVGRGFNSKDENYTVKLKLKMDIQSLSIDMSPLVNKSNNTLNETAFTATSLRDGYAGKSLWKNYSSTEDKVGQAYNTAPNKAVFKFYYPYRNQMKSSNPYTMDIGTGNPYYKLFYDFIKGTLMSDITIRASDGFRVNVKFMLDDGTLDSENVMDSEYSVDLYLNYYRNLPFDTGNITFSQSSSGISMSARYNTDNQIKALNVTINQYDYSKGNRATQTYLNSNTINGGTYQNYTASASFSYNNADCFSTKDLSLDVVSRMINNCYTQYVGYVQGGTNRFTVTPVHDGYDAEHNLLAAGTHYDTSVRYTVQQGPTVKINYDKGMHNDANTVISDSWIWDHTSTDNSYIEKEVINDEYWGYIENITASYSYTKGGSVKLSYSYGMNLSNGHGSSTVSGTASSEMTSFGSGQYNEVDIKIEVKCKEGFASVMSKSSDSDSLSISPGRGVQEYVPIRRTYDDRTNVMSNVRLSVTDGWMGGGSVGDYIGSIFKGGNRATRCTVECDASSLPSGFTFSFDVNANFRVSETKTVIEGLEEKDETHYRSGSNSGKVTATSGSTTSTSISGQYWETDSYWCLSSFPDFEGGSASKAGNFSRGAGPTSGATIKCSNCDGVGTIQGAHSGTKQWGVSNSHYLCSCGDTLSCSFWNDPDSKSWGSGCPKHIEQCPICKGSGYLS